MEKWVEATTPFEDESNDFVDLDFWEQIFKEEKDKARIRRSR